MLSGFTDAAAPGDESLLQNIPHNFARLSLSSQGGMRARECLTQRNLRGLEQDSHRNKPLISIKRVRKNGAMGNY